MAYITDIVVLLLGVTCGCQGVCTYAELDVALYDCFDSRSLTTEYALPVMSSTFDAISFCSTHLANIKSCVEVEIANCSANSSVTSFFGSGSDLSAAYTYICTEYDSNSNVEPFDCARNASTTDIKANLTAFDDGVDALASPTLKEICMLGETMISGFENEISAVCADSSTSLAIWKTFASMVLDACDSGAEIAVVNTVVLLLATITAALFNKV